MHFSNLECKKYNKRIENSQEYRYRGYACSTVSGNWSWSLKGKVQSAWQLSPPFCPMATETRCPVLSQRKETDENNVPINPRCVLWKRGR